MNNTTTITKSDFIRARIEPQVKKDAEEILKKIGLSMSESINIFLHQIKLHQGLPFSINIPNTQTRKVLKQTQKDYQNKKLKSYQTTDEMFTDILGTDWKK